MTEIPDHPDDDELRDYLGDEAAFRWMECILTSLREIFQESLSHMEAVALMVVLKRYQIVFSEGITVYEEGNLDRHIWTADAAIIASSLCHSPRENPIWWKGEYAAFPQEAPTFDRVVEVIAERISKGSNVILCEPIY